MYNINNISDTLRNQTEVRNTTQSMYMTVLKNVYSWMSFALVISGLTAMIVASNPAILSVVFANNISVLLMFLAQFGLIWFISSRINSISSLTATILFIIYSILTGITLSSVFLVFTQESITSVFFISAGTFAAVSLYGYTTKKDLSSWRSFLFMGLIGIIIASIVNWFMNSEMLYWIISYAGVLIFVGLTAYDTQKIKQMAYLYGNQGRETTQKIALIGAITLYLDFINLFLYLLRIFGKRK